MSNNVKSWHHPKKERLFKIRDLQESWVLDSGKAGGFTFACAFKTRDNAKSPSWIAGQ